jgi:4-amino-4-deoxy-L-arabinose transferase-like glycosyltransferase
MSNTSSAPAETTSYTATALILLGAFCRILSFCFSANTGGDAGAHVSLAAAWLQHPSLQFVFDVYPPGHFWLIALFTFVVHDVVLAGRLLSLVFGIASLFFVWKLARMLYGMAAGLLSLAVFSLYSLHIAYSTTSSAEVSYLFFVLLGLYFFFFSLQKQSVEILPLAFSGICLSVAESIRYEAWVLFGGLFFILAILGIRQDLGKRRYWIKPVLVFGSTGGAWALFMLTYSRHAFGDPMYLVSLNHLRVTSYLAAHSISLSYQLTLMPVALLISLSPLAMAGAIYGLTISFSGRLIAAFASLTLFFALIQFYELCTGGLLATARYTLTLGTMLALVSGYGLQGIFEKLFSTRISLARNIAIGILFLNVLAVLGASEYPNRYAEQFASVSPRLRNQARIEIVAHYLRNHLKPDDAIVIDDYNVESNLIANAAGVPIVPGKRAYLVSRKNEISVHDYISAEHPRFLVYAKEGTLRRSLELSDECNGIDHIDRVQLRCTFESPIYRVYELTYPDVVRSNESRQPH